MHTLLTDPFSPLLAAVLLPQACLDTLVSTQPALRKQCLMPATRCNRNFIDLESCSRHQPSLIMLAHICGPCDFLLTPALSSSKSCSFSSSNQLALYRMPIIIPAASWNGLAALASAPSHVSVPVPVLTSHIHSLPALETLLGGLS